MQLVRKGEKEHEEVKQFKRWSHRTICIIHWHQLWMQYREISYGSVVGVVAVVLVHELVDNPVLLLVLLVDQVWVDGGILF